MNKFLEYMFRPRYSIATLVVALIAVQLPSNFLLFLVILLGMDLLSPFIVSKVKGISYTDALNLQAGVALWTRSE